MSEQRKQDLKWSVDHTAGQLFDAYVLRGERINELEAIENGLDDRITVLEDYITKLETTARQNDERHALKSMN